MSTHTHAHVKSSAKSSSTPTSKGLLQRSTIQQRDPDSIPTEVREVLRSPGQPLDPRTRAEMESRFGHDFSKVRVHSDAQAAGSAEAVSARAYTVGQHVVFGEGRYAPELGDRQRLLAHELAHVVQQERGGTAPPSLIPGSPLEQAANSAARAAIQGLGRIQVAGASAPGLARETDEEREKRLRSEALSHSSRMPKAGAGLLERWGPSPQIDPKVIQSWTQGEQSAAQPASTQAGVGVLGPLVLTPDFLSYAFKKGFLGAAQKTTPPDWWNQVKTELSDPQNLASFLRAELQGIPEGAWMEIEEGVIGLGKLLIMALGERMSFGANPKGYMQQKTQEASKLAEGLKAFVKQVASKPEILAMIAELAGEQIGQEEGKWIKNFTGASPQEKGKIIGRLQGRLLIETALLFVGPESVGALASEAVARAASTRLGKIVLEIIEGIPSLSEILKVRKIASTARTGLAAINIGVAEAAPVAFAGRESRGLTTIVHEGEDLARAGNTASRATSDVLGAEGKVAKNVATEQTAGATTRGTAGEQINSASTPNLTQNQSPTLIGRSTSQMRRDAARIIQETPNHRLKFLLDDKKFKRTRGLTHAELADDPDLVQMGHIVSNKSGEPERIMLQGAWENQFNNVTVEHPSMGGFMENEAIDIDGIAVDVRTAQWWEDIGRLPRGTVASAPKVR